MTVHHATTSSATAPPRRPEAPAAPSGVRSGVLLGAASAASILTNYIFLLAAGRLLGSEDYGSLAALLGLLAVVLLPAGALQMAVSREISRRLAHGDTDGADAFTKATLRLAYLATVPLMAVAVVLAAPLSGLLNIDSVGVVLLAESTLVTALVFPVAMGVLQGRQRFHALAVIYVFPFVLRLGVLAVVAAAGYGLGGVVFCNLVAVVSGTVAAVELIRIPRARLPATRPDLRPFLRYLGPVAIGLIGIALLTHVDILVVKARFSADDAGAYGAASAFARVGFFLPATILAVLFPRTAARQARGEETEDILGRSLLATAVFCAGLALFYAAAGEGLVVTTFGVDFAPGGRVLGPYALAIGLFSLANILVGYHLSRGEMRYAWIVAAGVVVQVAILATVPSGLHGVVWSNLAIGIGLIAAHEIFVGSSIPAVRAGLRHARGPALALRARLPEGLLVVLGATALVCILFWPVVAHLGSTIIGSPGSDSTGSVGWLWQLRHEGGFHILGVKHHTLSGAPFGWDQGNGLNVQWFLPYYPAYLVASLVGEVAAFNLVVLTGYVFSAIAMYVLVRYLGCSRPVAAWAALAYVVFPWHIARAEHASLLHLEVLALLVLALVAAARRPSLLRFALVGAATTACWLTSGYFGAMALVTTGAFAVGAAVTMDWRRAFRMVLGSTGAALMATAMVGVASVASGVNTGAGLERAAGDLSLYGLRPLELVVPSAQNLVLGGRLDSFWNGRGHGSNPTETANYLGLLTIALAVAWLVLALRRWRALDRGARSATAGLVTAFAAGLVFAAPSPILFFGHEVWTPSRLLWEVVPAFRVPSRWDPLLMTAIVPLSALGLQAVWARLADRDRRLPGAALAVVAAAMVFSFLELSISVAPHTFRTVPVPPEYAAVARTRPGVFVDYPLGYSDIYRLWQRASGRPLLNGAPPGTTADQARLALLDPTQPGTAQALSLLGVTAIGIHPQALVDAEVMPREPRGDPGYRLVSRFPDGATLWGVVAQPAPALVTLGGGFGPPTRHGPFVGYALTSSAGVSPIDLWAKEAGVVRLVFDAEPPPGSSRVLRLADATTERAFRIRGRTPVSALVALPRGHSQLLVKTDPPATSERDAIVLSGIRAERASGPPALHADEISASPGF